MHPEIFISFTDIQQDNVWKILVVMKCIRHKNLFRLIANRRKKFTSIAANGMSSFHSRATFPAYWKPNGLDQSQLEAMGL